MNTSSKGEQRLKERHLRLEKQRREITCADLLKDAKKYYGVPYAKPHVAARLVEWKKGEKCKPHNRRTIWDTDDEMRRMAKIVELMMAYGGHPNWAHALHLNKWRGTT